MPGPVDFLDLPRAAAFERMAGNRVGAGKALAIWKRVHRELADPFFEASTGDKKLDALKGAFAIRPADIALETHSSDGFTRKYLHRLDDGLLVETVLMYQNNRYTACVSTQAGCAQGCVFCATGQGGFRRHLRPGEMVAQIRHVAGVLAKTGERLRNIVLMGMGEPLHNYDAVRDFLHIAQDQAGIGIAPSRVTLSTVGIVPGILRMAEERLPAHLALSLHAANDTERAALIPVARKWPLAELMRACDTYTRVRREKIFYEWTLVGGKNDSDAHADELAALLAPRSAFGHVNLIPLNRTQGYAGEPTPPEQVDRFRDRLIRAGIPTTIRSRRGIDVAAGCGQLAAAKKN